MTQYLHAAGETSRYPSERERGGNLSEHHRRVIVSKPLTSKMSLKMFLTVRISCEMWSFRVSVYVCHVTGRVLLMKCIVFCV